METPDFGPVYAETNWEAAVKEPFNALSAAIYIVLAIIWLIRLHPLRAQHQFLYACLWILLIGGVGGTIYHAFRAHWVFLALDALPIAALGLATAVYAVRRLTRNWLWLVLPIVAVMGTPLLIDSLVPRSMSITLGYALLGVALLTPLVLLALRTQHGLWDRLAPAAALFFVALVFRAADLSAAALLPMGTHGLWHLFAAAAVYLLILFLRESPKDAGERASRRHVGLPEAG